MIVPKCFEIGHADFIKLLFNTKKDLEKRDVGLQRSSLANILKQLDKATACVAFP
jgi:hypothetical protein